MKFQSLFSQSQIHVAGRTISQAILLPIITALIIVVATLFPVRAVVSQLQANRAAIVQESKELESLKLKRDTLANLNDDKLTNDLTETRRALPEDKNVPGLIAGLLRLSQENNLQVVGMQLKPGKLASDSAQQSEIDVQLTLGGDIKNLQAFLAKLSQIRRVMGVVKINSSTGLSGNSLSSAVTLAVYTMQLPSAKDLGTSYANPLPQISQSSNELITKLSQMPVYTDIENGGSLVVATQSASPSTTTSPLPTGSPKIVLPSTLPGTSPVPGR